MMAQNTSEDKEIAGLDSHEITKPSESVELTPVGAIDDLLKPYFNWRDQLQKPSTGADEYDYFGFLSERGKIYEKALEMARPVEGTSSETERKEKFGERESILVDEVKKDFQTYPKGLPKCGRIECWAARLGLVNIVVGLVRAARGADDPESPTRMSNGLLALAIGAENSDYKMVAALEDIAVSDECFKSSEPASFSHNRELNLFYSKCATPVYELYPSHEVWLCPIAAAARLGRVKMVEKLIDMREAKMKAVAEEVMRGAEAEANLEEVMREAEANLEEVMREANATMEKGKAKAEAEAEANLEEVMREANATMEKGKATMEEVKREAKAKMEVATMEARILGMAEAGMEARRRREMKKEELFEEMMRDERSKCRRAFNWAVKMGHGNVVELLIKRNYIVDLNEACTVLGLLDNADVKSYGSRQTPLALAVLSGQWEVAKLLFGTIQGDLDAVAQTRKEIMLLQTAYQKAERHTGSSSKSDNAKSRGRILKTLMERLDTEAEVRRLTEERKVHVDAVNAILVGTALIATATFSGWLSPPLGYSSPPGTDGPFASVEGHPILERFWIFNSLSFFFSIATFMVGTNVAFPPPEDTYIGDVVQSLRWKLRLAYYLVSAAVFFVMGAFASAGFAVLPPIPKYTVNMALTVGIGVTVVAVVVFSTSFGHMFTKSGWEQLKGKMKFRCWQQSKHEMESSDYD